ncbi:murein biosynthesis integral membrane protein MurJ [Thalassoglobus sp. JC818]|uniref:murein biosynthesis integral membrane protein MurJ n=1 Tax=Thalassoglobus sp. JC818 TaxID=3232136 RepID=UPI003457C953
MSSEEPATEPRLPSSHSDSGVVRNLRMISLCTLLSRVLGLARDIVMASLFGAGTILDLFVVAFRLPNLTRQLFGEGALTAAFLPVFLRDRTEHGDLVARDTMTAVAIALSSFLSLFVLLAEGVLIWFLVTADLSESTTLLLQLLAILLPYLVLICTAALLSAGLHALQVFLWPALVPVVLNVFWLTGAFIAVQTTSVPEIRVKIVSLAILIAGTVQLALPMSALLWIGMGPTRSWRRQWHRVREVMWTMLPVVAGTTVIQCNAVLDSLMAWGLSRPDGGGPAPLESFGLPALLPAGTASELYIGQRMYQFPLGVFGVALGTVLYPLMAQHAQSGDLTALRKTLGRGLRLTATIAVPASAGLFLLATPLTNLMFRHGEFTEEDVQMTARMISIYGAGVWAYISLTILNRAFYALGDRISPMWFGIVTLVLNFLLNVVFVVLFRGAGLALGSVVATAIQVLMTVWLLNRRTSGLPWGEIGKTTSRTILATTLMVLVCLLSSSLLPAGVGMATYAVRLIVPLLAGILTYVVAGRIVGLSEIDEFLKAAERDSEPV